METDMRRETGFAERLRTLREESGLTLGALSEKAGLHLHSLAKLERGEREPKWGTVIDLAEALGVDVTAFLPRKRKPKK
jgi:transcriptional regulator with XRE-family HTH domain